MVRTMAENCGSFIGKKFGAAPDFEIKDMNVFKYVDPVDGAVADNQGIRIYCTDGSRIVFRLSGTGVAGATVRLYLEKFVATGEGALDAYVFDVVKPLGAAAVELAKLQEFTARDSPSVIT